MYKIIFGIAILSLISCQKKEVQNNTSKTDSTTIIDSINTARTTANNEIKNKNHFDLLTGDYNLTHSMINGKGNINFSKVEGNHDEYDVKGEVKNGKNYFKISGTVLRVSEKHFNFHGTTEQSITANDNGKVDKQNVNKTFLTKDADKTWKMQGMINASGFVDDIYIKRK